MLLVADRDGAGMAVAQAALERLESRDTVAIVDADGRRLVLPPVPCAHRTLATAALERRLLRHQPSMPRDLGWALRQSRELLSRSGRAAQVLAVVDADVPDARAVRGLAALERAGAAVVAIAAHDDVSASAAGPWGARLVTGDESSRLGAVKRALPAPSAAWLMEMALAHLAARRRMQRWAPRRHVLGRPGLRVSTLMRSFSN